ncbi:PREDICTED: uncharacterized protein LOC105453283 [Wasmannia auropunctata]|uniref:uncharacterized protein LOC105453283 n=1 Tax=Wasmannia auropunctata TaxID=64793 RepID=UPI0005EDAEAB|nr:PREDICTED: uncharacterized protein LOC105453283 [Wasmannia auropunctata]
MPAEIDTGGHRVLHCDSRADCPTATSIHVSTSPNESQTRRAPKDRRSRTGSRVQRQVAEGPLDRSRGNPPSDRGESSPTRVPRIDGEEETILGGRDFPARRSRALTRPSHRRRGGRGGAATRGENEDGDGHLGACCVPRRTPRAIEDVTKDERFLATWSTREDAGGVIERAGSRGPRRETTARYRRASCGHPIAKRRSLRDRSWTEPRPSFYGSRRARDADPIDHPGRLTRRTAGGGPLLSSHHSRTTRAKDEAYEDDINDEDFFREGHGNDKNGRLDRSGRRDERPQDERIDKLADRKRIRCACRVYSFLRLALVLFLVAFGQRYGPLGSSSARRVSAKQFANGLSVLGIGFIGAVNARPIKGPNSNATNLIEGLNGTTANRTERSTSENLSHMTGTARDVLQLYIKNRYLQILPDGTVNGSDDNTSNYTIFRRTSVSPEQVKIEGIATCLYLCMDPCGLLYGSADLETQECHFVEIMEPHNYNTYSSVRWSTANKTLYLGLDRYGRPRKVQAKGPNLGKLSAYARVLTRVVALDRVKKLQRWLEEQLIMGAQHKIRHRHGSSSHKNSTRHRQDICPSAPPEEKDGRDRFRCRKRKKRNRKRWCRSGKQPGPQCQVPKKSAAESDPVEASSEIGASSTTPESKRSCEGAASEEACRRQAHSVSASKRKSRIPIGNSTYGKSKPSTSNAKKPNVSVADSQSKKPDLTDGKKRKRKRTGQQRTSQGSTVASPPSRKQYGPGTTSSSRVSSSLTALASEEQRASTAALSSSPSPPGASTALFSTRRPSSLPSDRKKPPPSSRNHVTGPVGSRSRVGKFLPGVANSPDRPGTISTTSRSEVASLPSTTKVPEDTYAYTVTPLLPHFSPVLPSSSLPRQESDEDSSSSLSYSSPVDEESSSTVTSELATVESSTLAASDEDIAEITTFRLNE